MTLEDDHTISLSKSDTGGHDAQQVTVLVADDDADFRETLCLWLANEDTYETNDVQNGERAIAQLDETVDILVLDRQMPKLSGPEVVERLDKTSFDGAVIVLSADTADSALDENDVTEYLTKPIGQALFLDTMRRSI
ncbi:response regulator [Haloplanus halobius]|uniref:response regulator n=1 Tax=Haloplanus halobius TaxID=2934938 RepID=UPI00200FA198|nr:response regulator [Haloplanus sp. XH21]